MTPQELKNSIILLAIQGKLVEQRVQEGSARQLIEAIVSDRQQKISNKVAKENKKTEPITEESIPFDIPDSWEWIRFGDMVYYNMGKTPPRAESQWWGDGFPWVSIADMLESGHIARTKEQVSFAAISEKFSGKVSKAGTLLMSFKLTVGRVSVLDIDAVHNEAIISIYPYADDDHIIQNYLFVLLPYISQYGESKNAIKGKTLNDTSMSNLLIPLPPLAEQKRIVAKIEELLPLIDRYEQAWSKLEDFNKRFPVDMQKSIIQMAIQGKLVPQIFEEGTGEELFQQIQADKQALIKEGKIKKEKPLPEITEDEIPFDIPETWKWCRLSELVTLENGDRSNRYPVDTDYVDYGIPFFGAKDMNSRYMSFENVRYISAAKFAELGNGKLENNDFICLLRGSVGKIAQFKEDINHKTGFICAQMVIVRAINSDLVDYLYTVMTSPYYFGYIERKTTGTAVRQLPAKELGNLLLPLPPLVEQKRIVAKLEEILPLCELLK